MNRILITLLLAAGSMQHGPAIAQDAASGDALYKALGQKPRITLIVDDFVNRMPSDGRIGAMFKNTKLPNLKEQLRDQFCVLSGGPCKYEADTMKASHADLGINKANFNTAVKLLQLAMDDQRMRFARRTGCWRWRRRCTAKSLPNKAAPYWRALRTLRGNACG